MSTSQAGLYRALVKGFRLIEPAGLNSRAEILFPCRSCIWFDVLTPIQRIARGEAVPDKHISDG
jgi:hypothetical protein